MSAIGFFKGLTKFILGLLLTVSLVILLASSSLSQFTEYNNLKPHVTSMIESSAGAQMPFDESNFSQFKTMASYSCEGKESLDLPFAENMALTINCSDVQNLQSMQQLKTIIYDQIFDKIYYNDYGCSDLIQCFKAQKAQNPQGMMASAGPLFVFSKIGHDSLAKYAQYSLIAVIVFAILLLLFKPFAASFGGVGVSFMLVGLGTFFMPLIQNEISKRVTGAQIIMPIIAALFEIMKKRSMTFFIIGVVLIVIGIILGIIFRGKPKNNKEKKKK